MNKASKEVKKFGKVFSRVVVPEELLEKTNTVHIVPINKFATEKTILKAIDTILEVDKKVPYFSSRKHIEKTEATDVLRCTDYGLTILKCRFNKRDYSLEVS